MPSGPAVWPEPAATSISIIVSLICSAFSAITSTSLSLTDICFSIQRVIGLFGIIRSKNSMPHYEPVSTRLHQPACGLHRDAAVNLYREVGVALAQTLYKRQ